MLDAVVEFSLNYCLYFMVSNFLSLLMCSQTFSNMLCMHECIYIYVQM